MNAPEDAPVKSIARMAQLLRTLQRLDGAGVTELAQELNTSKSTVYNHLRSLEQCGYVVQKGNHYSIGLGFLDHGEYARSRRDGYQLIRQKVRELAGETGELCQYLVEEHGLGVFIVRESGDQAVETSTRIGNRVHLNHVTAGKALLAYSPPEKVSEIVDQHGLPQKTAETITSVDALETELKAIRERRYAIDREEHLKGLYAIGVPIQGSDGRLLGALSVAGPANRINREQRAEEIAQILLEKANEVELTLTHSSS